jgi:site-specific DNA-methyltransferase (adenine-specific)
MERLIKAVTPSEGIVLDPCMGSGATGVAAVQSGYRFIGCELDPEHFSTAEDRIGAITAGVSR